MSRETHPYREDKRQGWGEGDTRIRLADHGIPTARRFSLRASRYSSSVHTQMSTSPVWAVAGAESALKPCRHEASSICRSTICPGSGIRAGLLMRGSSGRLTYLDMPPPHPLIPYSVYHNGLYSLSVS